MLFDVFNFEYIDDQKETRQMFTSDHFISQAKYYNLRSKIDNEFNQTNMFTRSAILNVHQEFTRRMQITKIYYHYFHGIEDPFPELSEITTKFVNTLVMTYKLSLTPSEKAELRLFFQIQAQRIQHRNFVNIRDIVKPVKNDNVDIIQRFYSNHVAYFDKSDVCSEMAYLMSFLVSQDYISNDKVEFSTGINGSFNTALLQFEKILLNTKMLKHDLVSDDDLRKAAEKLSTLNHKLLIFDFQIGFMDATSYESQVARDFPGLQSIAFELTDSLIQVFKLDATDQERARIANNYLLELVSELPDGSVEDRVSLCVDFSGNRSTRDYIVHALNHYFDKNVDISTKLNKKSDIYLSDVCNESIRGIPQITLPLFPSKNNLKRLSDLIFKVRKNKLKLLTD
ncbi:hypothetical protein [Paucilactobacillus suebicus]|nr:hypothetical protein [Paucilactobacillus suebicus]